MADDVLLNPATSTGATIATDEIGGRHYQIGKLAYGPLDSATIVASTTPLPVISSATAIQISNPTTAVSIANPTTAVSATITNPTTAVSAIITNPTTSVSVSNPTTAVSVSGSLNALTQSATANSIQAVDPLDKLLLATGSSYAPQYATIAVSSSGNNTLVSNTGAGIKVTVLSMALISNSVGQLYFQDGASSVLFGSSNAMIAPSSNGGFILPYNPKGWFRTGSSANLILHNSLGSTIAGSLTYVLSS